MFYARVENGNPVEWPLSTKTVRERLQILGVAVPAKIEKMDTKGYGYYPVEVRIPPKPPFLHDCILSEPGWDEKGENLVRMFSSVPKSPEKQRSIVRTLRNQMLAKCDWTVLPDANLTEEQKNHWLTYRQKLRDIFENDPEPLKIHWPLAPNNPKFNTRQEPDEL